MVFGTNHKDLMNAEQRKLVKNALAQYGAAVSEGDLLQKGERALGIKVSVKAGRLRFVSLNGVLYMSGPLTQSCVEEFVERFWCWEKPK
jgi:hypothetical protein